MVGVGSGASVAGKATGVTFETSSAMQDVSNIVIARRAVARRGNLLMSWGLLRREEISCVFDDRFSWIVS